MARPRGLPRSSEVRVGCPPLGRAERTFWVRLRPYGWISSFFIAVFCSTQLASSIAVPGVPLYPQEELMVTRDHRIDPFWALIFQPATTCSGFLLHDRCQAYMEAIQEP